MKRYRPELWEGRTQDQVTLTYATCLGLALWRGLTPLNDDLGLLERHAELVPLGPGRDSSHLGIKNPARREQEGSQ